MRPFQWPMVAGMLVTTAFVVLLLIRLDFFQTQTPPAAGIKAVPSQQPQDIWMAIYQNDQKIGFVHRTLAKNENGFAFNENVFMEISAMGMPQALNLATEGQLNADMTLSSFNFKLNSSLFQFHIHGRVAADKLILYTDASGRQRKNEIPLQDLPHISGNIYDAAFHAGMDKGTTRGFSIFDPSSMSVRTINVTRNADEIIPIMGNRLLLRKYCADFMGAKHCAWLDKDGQVFKETGMLGLSMEKTSQENALAEINRHAGVDFSHIASIPSNADIADPETLHNLQIRISGMTPALQRQLHLDGDRQRYHDDVLTITREEPEDTGSSGELPADVAVFLKPDPLIQSDDPQIRALIGKIVRPADSALVKAKKIINWVFSHIEKKPALSVPNALEVLKNRSGDCNEHAVLTVALLRAAGIPARSETGLVYLRGRFYYHAWCVFYINRWITADPVFNQIPADVTHIRLLRGETDQQIRLIGVIGQTNLEVLSQTR